MQRRVRASGCQTGAQAGGVQHTLLRPPAADRAEQPGVKPPRRARPGPCKRAGVRVPLTTTTDCSEAQITPLSNVCGAGQHGARQRGML